MHFTSHLPFYIYIGFTGGAVVKNPPANAGDARDVSSILGLGRFLGKENSNQLLGNSTDRKA